MQAMANIGLRAARQAGQIMVRSMDRLDVLRVEQKGHNDFVSEIDRDCESVIVEALHRAYPDHAIRGEEHGESIAASNGSDYTWIIDPLDGTTNFINGIPHFCISITALKGRQIEHGIIVDPVQNEEFVGSRGHGAQRQCQCRLGCGGGGVNGPGRGAGGGAQCQNQRRRYAGSGAGG